MKRWIGRWLIAVSAIHTLFAIIVFNDVLRNIVLDGMFDTVGDDPLKGAVVWFLLFGFVLFICGIAIDEIEKKSTSAIPLSIGWSIVALSALGVILMPASGFWLMFPPAVAILINKPVTKPLSERA